MSSTACYSPVAASLPSSHLSHLRRPLNVLFLVTANTYGGAEHSIFKLALNLNRALFTPKIACLGNNALFIQRFRDHGIPIFPLNMRWVGDPRPVLKLYTLLRRKQIDILHTQLFKSDIYGRISGKLAGTTVMVSTIQNMEAFRKFPVLNRLDAFTAGWTDKIISVSDLVRDHTIQKTGLPANKFTTIYNFVDPDDYHPSFFSSDRKSKLRAEMGLSREHVVIGTVGRLTPQKSQKDFLTAARDVLSAYPHTRFLIAGEGPLKNELQKTAADLDIKDKVIFTGFIKDIRNVFSILDIFVLSSLWEGLPLTICEAMASKIPVVSTNAGGVPEIVLDGVTGLLTDIGNPKQLADKIRLLVSDPQQRISLTRAARAQVLSNFSVKQITEQIERLYLKLAAFKWIDGRM